MSASPGYSGRMGKTVMVVGGGGREHALARAFSESPSVDEVICCPGNAGTGGLVQCRNAAASGNAGIVELAGNLGADMVVPGPEGPLAEGLIDDLRTAGLAGFGPPAASARLEASKGFAKDFMLRNGVSTGAYRRFRSAEAALSGIDEFGFPAVVKADGLAAGKGVLICADRREAAEAVEDLMVRRRFDGAGDEIVLEECLTGWETSIIGIVDGEHFAGFPPARDHKRAGDGDTGPNTGGMGVTAPHPLVDRAVQEDIRRNIIDPTMRGLAAEGLSYPGFLFIGVMVTPLGARALEYNVRFGDPEAQALLPLLDGDLDDYVQAALEGRLSRLEPRWKASSSCCVVMASRGYPGDYPRGFPITGMHRAEEAGCRVYCAGVRMDEGGRMLSDGGRVLGVTCAARSGREAREGAYRGIPELDFQGGWYRSDIGDTEG